MASNGGLMEGLIGTLTEAEGYGFELTDEELELREKAFGLVAEYEEAIVERDEAEAVLKSYDKNRRGFDAEATLRKGTFVAAWDREKPDVEALRYRVSVLDAALKVLMGELSRSVYRDSNFEKRIDRPWMQFVYGDYDETEVTLAEYRALETAGAAAQEVLTVMIVANAHHNQATPEEIKKLRKLTRVPTEQAPTITRMRWTRDDERSRAREEERLKAAEKRKQYRAEAALNAAARAGAFKTKEGAAEAMANAASVFDDDNDEGGSGE